MTALTEDRRLLPSNGRVAHSSLKGIVSAESFTDGIPARIAVPVAPLLERPRHRDRELLFGESFQILDQEGLFSFGISGRDGYVGWVTTSQLTTPAPATHRVCTPATHGYGEASIKSADYRALSMGSLLSVVDETDLFVVTDLGWHVPRGHVCRVDEFAADPVAVAEGFLGTPYLWAGNSRAGIDCSGLVQMSLLACGIPCPGDSDLQRSLGREVDPTEPYQRGDLLFWKGHVAFVADRGRMLHANGHSMSVAYEGLEPGLARIEASGTPLLCRRRLP